MDELQGTATLVTLFALRCIAPLAFTIGIGYLMNRLVDRWQAEDAAMAESEVAPEVADKPAPGRKLPTVTVPCWILRNCEPAQQAECPARQQPGLACWLVRLRSDGALPGNCPDCPIYAQDMALKVA